jgi:HAD superfamily hydrolase (TIGR01509 family)
MNQISDKRFKDYQSLAKYLGNVQAILFDLDGTIFNLNVDWDSIKTHFREYHKEKFNEERKWKRFHPNFNYIREEYGEKALDYYYNYLKKKEMETVLDEKPKPLWLIREGFNKISKLIPEQAVLGIVSSNYHATIVKLLKLYNVNQKFKFIIGRDDVLKAKPNPEGLQKIIKKGKLNSSKVLFVGDAETDREAAKRANIPFIHIDVLKKLLE